MTRLPRGLTVEAAVVWLHVRDTIAALHVREALKEGRVIPLDTSQVSDGLKPDIEKFSRWVLTRVPLNLVICPAHATSQTTEKVDTYTGLPVQTMPAVVLIPAGFEYTILDGNHRVTARKRCGDTEITAYVAVIEETCSEE